MSEKSNEMLCEIIAAVPRRTKDELGPILVKKNSSDLLVGTSVLLKDPNREDQQRRIIMQ